jgi:autotransporter-associated beta strand protein
MAADQVFRVPRAMSVVLAVSVVVLLAPVTWAATYTWDGGGSDPRWSISANWNPDAPEGAPDSASTTTIVFSGTTNPGTSASPLNQNLASPFVLNSLQFDNSTTAFFYLGGGQLRFVANGGVQPTLTNSGGQNKTVANPIEVPSATVLTLTNHTYTCTFSGAITGEGALVKSGGGVIYLGGAGSNYSGGLTFNGTGTSAQWSSLLIPVASAVGTGLITLNGGNITPYDGSVTSTNKYPGGLIFIGSNMAVANNFTLQADSPVFIGSPVSGNSSNSATFSGNFDLNGKTLYLRGLGTGTINGQITGSGGLTKLDTSTWLLNQANNYVGPTTVRSGTLKLGVDNALPTSTSVTLDGTTNADSTLDLNGHSLTIAGLNDAAGTYARRLVNSGTRTPTLTVNNATACTFAGTLGDSGQASLNLIKQGNGRLTLAGANAYTGTTEIQKDAILVVQHGSALGSTTAGTSIANGGLLEVKGGVTVAEPLTLSGGGTTASPWAGALRSVDNGNTWSGLITLAAGGNRIGITNSGVFNLTGGLTGDHSLQFAGAANGTIVLSNQPVSIKGSLGVVDSTTLRVDVTGNSWSTTSISYGGTLKLGINDALPASTVVTLGSTNSTHGTLDLNGFNQTIVGLNDLGTGNRRVLNSSTGTSILTISNSSSDYTFAGTLGVTGQAAFGLVKSGTRTFVLSGANLYSGATSVEAGTLSVRNASALGGTTAGTTVAANARLEVQGGITLDEPVTLSGEGGDYKGALRSVSGVNTWSAPITIAASGARIGVTSAPDLFQITGGITGTGASYLHFGGMAGGTIRIADRPITIGSTALRALDNTTLQIDVAGNSWGQTHASHGGKIKLGTNNALPTSTVVSLGQVNNTDGTLDLNGFDQTIAGLTDAGTGSRKIVSSGTGTPTLTVNNATNDTFAGTLGNTAQDRFNLVKTGSGTLTLSGTNTYSGTTTVNGGRLLVDGSLSSGGGDVTVNGGVLGGRGSILRNVILNPGATLAPGASTGTFHTGNVAFAEGSIFAAELGAAGYDQLDVTGTVNLANATLDLSLLFAPVVGDQFLLINNDGTDAVIGTFSGLAEGSPVLLDYGGQSYEFRLTYAGGSDSNDVVLLSAVPEPASLLLALAALLGLVALRRR